VIEPVLLTTVPISTLLENRGLTTATGFFFERDERLWLVTSRHVFHDEPSGHFPDEIRIDLHTDADNLANASAFSIPLYSGGVAAWRQGEDETGSIDVALIEIDRDALPATTVYYAFSPDHLLPASTPTEVGTPLLIVGFPLGFRDTLHHMAVVRHAIVASSFGLRFTGQGYFLTDGRTHRGSSGAPVVMRIGDAGAIPGELQYRLLGIHSARLDLLTRDLSQDEALGLNCAWYADILMTLSEDRIPPAEDNAPPTR
jgi:hypothetical protein